MVLPVPASDSSCTAQLVCCAESNEQHSMHAAPVAKAATHHPQVAARSLVVLEHKADVDVCLDIPLAYAEVGALGAPLPSQLKVVHPARHKHTTLGGPSRQRLSLQGSREAGRGQVSSVIGAVSPQGGVDGMFVQRRWPAGTLQRGRVLRPSQQQQRQWKQQQQREWKQQRQYASPPPP